MLTLGRYPVRCLVVGTGELHAVVEWIPAAM